MKSVELKRFGNPPPPEAAQLLDSALHSLVVAWIDEEMLANADFIRWLANAWHVVDVSHGQHGMLLAFPHEGLQEMFRETAERLNEPAFASSQWLSWEQLGEKAARPAAAALLALEKSRELLCRGLGQPRRKLRLFISHAKHDGLSLAQALTRAVGGVPGSESFYDANDIMPGSNWKSELQQGVETSVLVVVRTDGYDERPWCVQEVAWAEHAGVPIIVVEARSDLSYPPSLLPLGAAPWVRVPDGSLTRILYCALRENLRLLIMRRGVHQLGPKVSSASVVLPRAPSLESLDGALRQLSKSNAKARFVVYPDPKLPPQMSEAVDYFASKWNKKTRVVTYADLLAETAATP